MSPNHPPILDLNAVEDRLRDRTDERFAQASASREDPGIAAFATEARRNGSAMQFPPVEDSEEQETSPPVPHLGAEAAANMTRLSKAAADDIRLLGRLALQAGKKVQEECEQMAVDIEANGGTIAHHLTGLSQLLADVGMSNRETLRRLLGDASRSIVPPSGRVGVHAVKQTASHETPADMVPFAKKSRRTN